MLRISGRRPPYWLCFPGPSNRGNSCNPLIVKMLRPFRHLQIGFVFSTALRQICTPSLRPPCHSALDAESRILGLGVSISRPKPGRSALNWLCFFALKTGPHYHNPFLIKRLCQLSRPTNWLCFFKMVSFRAPGAHSPVSLRRSRRRLRQSQLSQYEEPFIFSGGTQQACPRKGGGSNVASCNNS